MGKLVFIVALLAVGAWGWNKFGSDVTTVWNASKSVTTKSKNEIVKAKEKIGKALSIFDNLKLGEDKKKSTSTNHRKTDKRICRKCKGKIVVGIWGDDKICHKCFQLTKGD